MVLPEGFPLYTPCSFKPSLRSILVAQVIDDCAGSTEVSCSRSWLTAKGDHELSSIATDTLPAASPGPLALWQNQDAAQAARPLSTLQLVPNRDGLEIRIPIRRLEDIVSARRSGRLLARQMGCSGSRIALILTAISELSRNIIMYAGFGEIILSRSPRGKSEAIVVTARDKGPGIADVKSMLEPAQLGAGGMGLIGLKLCMDRFSIDSRQGTGTRVTCEVLSA